MAVLCWNNFSRIDAVQGISTKESVELKEARMRSEKKKNKPMIRKRSELRAHDHYEAFVREKYIDN